MSLIRRPGLARPVGNFPFILWARFWPRLGPSSCKHPIPIRLDSHLRHTFFFFFVPGRIDSNCFGFGNSMHMCMYLCVYFSTQKIKYIIITYFFLLLFVPLKYGLTHWYMKLKYIGFGACWLQIEFSNSGWPYSTDLYRLLKWIIRQNFHENTYVKSNTLKSVLLIVKK